MEQTCLLNFVPFFWLQISMVCFAMAATNVTLDQIALLSLKDQISDDPHGFLANWNANAPVCSWIGVTCGVHHHRVTALNLSHMDLHGTIPSNIFNMSSLEMIDLSFNGLTGRFPMDICSHLPNLQGLYMSGNQLYGEIPSSLFKCRQLQVLSLSNNYFTGSIQSEIGNLTMLKKLHLSRNNLSGKIPQEIGYPANMENLRISNNHITRSIANSIGNCSLLKEINLSENNLSGAIPSEIGKLHMLELLRINYNILSGNIPNTFGNLRNLQVLDLADNSLTNEHSTPESSFLSSLTRCKHLRKIELSGNPLNAALPNSIGNLSASLEQFLANNCYIRGSIPTEIGNLTSLIALNLGNNELTATMPTTIGRLIRLQSLNLQGNKLQGNLTNDLCYLDSLAYLYLGGNKLFGSIPDCLGNLTALRYLDLSSNNFSSILFSFWNLKDILTINMSSNLLRSSLPTEIVNLRAVIEIDLSKNQLSGEIPFSSGFLNTLAYLSLAENQLQGSIPGSFGNAVNLEFLDLSCNHLSGEIPRSLVALRYLKYFNVSFNRLQGAIPHEGPFANFSSQSYMNNDALCGAPLLQVPPCKRGDQVPPCKRGDQVGSSAPFLQVPTRKRGDQVPPCKRGDQVGSSASIKIVALTLKLILPIIGSIILALRRPKRKMPPSIASGKIRWTTPKNRRISYQKIQQATDGFSDGNLLGTGSFGSVYKGTLRNGMVVAIKVFHAEERSLRSFDVECEVMHSTGHRNLVRILYSCSTINFKALMMEYMANGSLAKWLHTYNYRLDILQRLDIMLDAASAVKYLHYDCSRQIIHCDLKPSNILLDEDMIAHVSDFSIAKLIDTNSLDPSGHNTLACTIGYAAPEYGLYGIVSTNTDVYSFGIMLMETFTGKKPTDEMFAGEMSLRRWVIESLPHEVNRVIDPSLLQSDEEHIDNKMECLSSIMRLAQCCSAESPSERLNMKEVVNTLNRIKKLFLKNISRD